MRHSVAGVLAFLSLTPLLLGCQQTTIPGQSPLTPVQSTGALAPIRPTSGIGPLGGSLRVPPPPTGGFSVPNNYMGGTQPSNQLGATQPSFGPSFGAGLANSQANSNGFGVQPSGWVQSGNASLAANANSQAGFVNQTSVASRPLGAPAFNSNSFNPAQQPSQPGPLQANAERAQSGGMRVIDLTQAPAPPGYRGQSFPGQNYNGQSYNGQASYGQNYNGYQAPVNQFNAPQFNGQQLNGQQFNNQFNAVAPSNVAPANFNTQTQGNFNSSVTNAFPQNSSFRPDANVSVRSRINANSSAAAPAAEVASRPNQLMQTREFEMNPSPLAPTFSGVTNFDDKPPSTEPVGSGLPNAQDELPWRRPDVR